MKNNKTSKVKYNVSGSKSEKNSKKSNTQTWEIPRSDRNKNS